MAEEAMNPELAGGTEAPETEAPATEAPATEAPATEAPATEAPATEAPATEAPATEAPATEAPATEAPAAEDPASASDPNAQDPNATDPNAQDPNATDPAATDPAATDPAATPATPSTPTPAADTEYFNYEGIKSCFDELNAEFEAFAKTIKTLNDTIQEEINVGPDSGVLGGYGTSLITLWNNNASTFGDFYKNFEDWSATVVSLANANGGFEGLTADMFANHQSTGGTLDGVAQLRTETAISQGALKVDGKDIYDENNTITIGDFTYVRSIDEYGNTIIRKYDKDGNLVEIKLVTADGKNPELTKVADGYEYTFKDERGNDVTYVYDENGHLIAVYGTDKDGKKYCIMHTNDRDQYDPNVSERYIWDESKGEWVLDTSGQTAEANKYIEDCKDANGEIDFEAAQEGLNDLSPEARKLVIDQLAAEFISKYGADPNKWPAEYRDKFMNGEFDDEFTEALNNKMSEDPTQQGTYHAESDRVYNQLTDGDITQEDLDAYNALSPEEKAIVDNKLYNDFQERSQSLSPAEYYEEFNKLPEDVKNRVLADSGYDQIERGTGYVQYSDSNGNYKKYYDNGTVEVFEDGIKTTTSQDATGNTTVVVDNGSQVTTTVTDSTGKLVSTKVVEDGVTSTYNGEATAANLVSKEYTENGIRYTETYTDGKISGRTYTENGTKYTETYEDGQMTQRTYGTTTETYTNGKLTGKTYTENNVQYTERYENEQLVERSYGNCVETYSGGVISQKVTTTSTQTITESYQGGNLKTKVTVQGGSTTTENFNPANGVRTSTITDNGQGTVVTDTYAANGKLSTKVTENSIDNTTRTDNYNVSTGKRESTLIENHGNNSVTSVKYSTDGSTEVSRVVRYEGGTMTFVDRNGKQVTFNTPYDIDDSSNKGYYDETTSTVQGNALFDAASIDYCTSSSSYDQALADAPVGGAIVCHLDCAELDFQTGSGMGKGFYVDASNGQGGIHLVIIKVSDNPATFSVPGISNNVYTYDEMLTSSSANQFDWY